MQKQLQFRIELHQQSVLAEQEKQFEMKTLTAFDNCCSGLWCHWAKSSALHYRNIFLNDLKFEHNWKVQSHQNLCRKFAISGKVNSFFQKSYRMKRVQMTRPAQHNWKRKPFKEYYHGKEATAVKGKFSFEVSFNTQWILSKVKGGELPGL